MSTIPATPASPQQSQPAPDALQPDHIAASFDFATWLNHPSNTNFIDDIVKLADRFLASLLIDNDTVGTDEEGLVLSLRDLDLASFDLNRYVTNDLAGSFALNTTETEQLANLLRPQIDDTVRTVFARHILADPRIQADPDYAGYFAHNRDLPNPHILVQLIIDTELNDVLDATNQEIALALYQAGSACVSETNGSLKISLPDIEYTDEGILLQGSARVADCSANPGLCAGGMTVAVIFPPSMLVMGALGIGFGIKRIVNANKIANSDDDVLRALGTQEIGRGASQIMVSAFVTAKGVEVISPELLAADVPLGTALPARLQSPTPLVAAARPSAALPGPSAPAAAEGLGEIVFARTTAEFTTSAATPEVVVGDVVAARPAQPTSTASTPWAEASSPKPTLVRDANPLTLEALLWPKAEQLPVVWGQPAAPTVSPTTAVAIPGMPAGFDPLYFASLLAPIDTDEEKVQPPGDAYWGPDLGESHATAAVGATTPGKTASSAKDNNDDTVLLAPRKIGLDPDHPIRIEYVNSRLDTAPLLTAIANLPGTDAIYMRFEDSYAPLQETPRPAYMDGIQSPASKIGERHHQLVIEAIKSLAAIQRQYPGRAAEVEIEMGGEIAFRVRMDYTDGKPTFHVTIPENDIDAKFVAGWLGLIFKMIGKIFYPQNDLYQLVVGGQLAVVVEDLKFANDIVSELSKSSAKAEAFLNDLKAMGISVPISETETGKEAASDNAAAAAIRISLNADEDN